MKQYIDQIHLAVTPSSIISRKVQLKQRAPDEYLGLCPFHNEKTPSFTVSDKKGFYHCFGCGNNGDIFSFLMKQEGLSYKEALEELARIAGVKLPKYTPRQIEEERKIANVQQILEATARYYHNKLFSFEGKKAIDYLKNRGLSDETIAKFRLGYAPPFPNELSEFLLKNFNRSDIISSTALLEGSAGSLYNLLRGRVIFPIIDKRGKVIAFGGRTLGDSEPKYINSPDNPVFKKGQNLYGMHWNYEPAFKAKQAIIVEGYMDVISLAEKGINYAFAPLGTALKLDQIKLLWPIVDDPVICMDSDNAGRNAAEKIALTALAEVKAGKSLKFITIQNAKDPDELVNKYGVETFKSLLDNALPLADMLFGLEKAKKPFKTPEQQVDLKQRLQQLCATIKESTLQKSYRQFFMDRYYALFSKKFTRKKANDNAFDQEAFVTSVIKKENYYEREILAVAILYPELLFESELVNYLNTMEVSCKKLDMIREKLLLIIDELPHPKSDDDELKKMQQVILTSLKPEINLEDVLGLKDFLHLEDPKAHIERILKLDELRSIQEKVVYVQEFFCKQPSHDLFDKLKHLKQIEEQLKLQLGIN
jgi:DNA primase